MYALSTMKRVLTKKKGKQHIFLYPKKVPSLVQMTSLGLHLNGEEVEIPAP